jgi:hypothetical protein
MVISSHVTFGSSVVSSFPLRLSSVWVSSEKELWTSRKNSNEQFGIDQLHLSTQQHVRAGAGVDGLYFA